MLSLTWQEYAEWLVAIEGMDVQDAVIKAAKMYTKQYKKLIDEEEVKQFYDDRIKVRKI